MSLSVIYIPDTGESWDNAWEASEYGRKGDMSISLTGYDTTSAPLVASGSWFEAAGSIFKCTSDDTPSGTPSGGLAYIKMVTSGSTSTLIATPTWTNTVPAWSDSYQGYYIDTYRVVAGCYYVAGDTSYNAKVIMRNQHCTIVNEYLAVSHLGWPDPDGGNIDLFKNHIQIASAAVADKVYIPLTAFFREGDIVSGFQATCPDYTSGNADVDLFWTDGDSSTDMASLNVNSANTFTDSSITDRAIDLGYGYGIYIDPANTSVLNVGDFAVKVVRRTRV